MNTFKGTPGPWVSKETDPGTGIFWLDEKSTINPCGYIATVWNDAGANAALIAAAPEMLAMLEMIADGVAVEDTDINLLIAKATTI